MSSIQQRIDLAILSINKGYGTEATIPHVAGEGATAHLNNAMMLCDMDDLPYPAIIAELMPIALALPEYVVTQADCDAYTLRAITTRVDAMLLAQELSTVPGMERSVKKLTRIFSDKHKEYTV